MSLSLPLVYSVVVPRVVASSPSKRSILRVNAPRACAKTNIGIRFRVHHSAGMCYIVSNPNNSGVDDSQNCAVRRLHFMHTCFRLDTHARTKRYGYDVLIGESVSACAGIVCAHNADRRECIK